MILGKGKYSQFNAIEGEVSDEECRFLETIHGKNFSVPSDEEDSFIEKFLTLIYDFSEEKAKLKDRFKQVINTDILETSKTIGPCDRVFHVMY